MNTQNLNAVIRGDMPNDDILVKTFQQAVKMDDQDRKTLASGSNQDLDTLIDTFKQAVRTMIGLLDTKSEHTDAAIRMGFRILATPPASFFEVSSWAFAVDRFLQENAQAFLSPIVPARKKACTHHSCFFRAKACTEE